MINIYIYIYIKIISYNHNIFNNLTSTVFTFVNNFIEKDNK